MCRDAERNASDAAAKRCTGAQVNLNVLGHLRAGCGHGRSDRDEDRRHRPRRRTSVRDGATHRRVADRVFGAERNHRQPRFVVVPYPP